MCHTSSRLSGLPSFVFTSNGEPVSKVDDNEISTFHVYYLFKDIPAKILEVPGMDLIDRDVFFLSSLPPDDMFEVFEEVELSYVTTLPSVTLEHARERLAEIDKVFRWTLSTFK